jgi:hypothetical protein
LEFPQEVERKIERIGPVDLLLGFSGTIGRDQLKATVDAALAGLNSAAGRVAVTCAGMTEEEEADAPDAWREFVPYPVSMRDPTCVPWVEMAGEQRSVLALAARMQARACVVMHGDLAALDTRNLALLAGPLLDDKCDLVTPVYPEGKYDGLINKALLAPLSRALYGRRVESPLPFDFGASGPKLAKLAESGLARGQTGPQMLWPANEIAIGNGRICQARMDVKHAPQTEGLELSTVLGQLAGAIFSEMESCAPHWQRVRGSQPVPVTGTPVTAEESADGIDTSPMVESFLLGSRNLEELWRLVLPPATVLELKHLARAEADNFRMPDSLWVRVVYDFALAYRLRRIGRMHLLGAFTPLYLGWAASYVQEAGNVPAPMAHEIIERLARAYEENKPYLVSRWRWPERLA